MATRFDPYQVLGVAPDATETEVKSAYRRLVKRYHPDLNPDDDRAAERFRDVRVAFDSLDRARRRDRRRHRESRPSQPDGTTKPNPAQPDAERGFRLWRRGKRQGLNRREEILLSAAVIVATLIWIVYYLWSHTKTNWF